MKKALKIGGIILLIGVILFFAYFIYLQTLVRKGELIKWEGKWYAKEDWRAQFGDYDTPEKNTPEQVYAQFRQALLNDDIETALGLIVEDERGSYREAFKDKDKFNNWVKILPENITKQSGQGNLMYYDLNAGDNYKHTVSFVKDRQGYWQIDSI